MDNDNNTQTNMFYTISINNNTSLPPRGTIYERAVLRLVFTSRKYTVVRRRQHETYEVLIASLSSSSDPHGYSYKSVFLHRWV